MIDSSGSSMERLSRLRRWWRTQTAQGRFARAAVLVRACLSLCRFHPPERFLNQLTVAYKTITRGWRRVSFEPCVIQRIFHVYVEESGQGAKVFKLPRGDNQYSCRFIRTLRAPERFQRYEQILQGICKDPWMGPHCLEVASIRRDGGYVTEFIRGFNLAHLRTKLFAPTALSEDCREPLIDALNQLLIDLRGYYAEHGQIIGDWPLHNLVFCPTRKTVINVDAEGFFSFDTPSVENQFPLIEANLLDIIEYLRLLSSPTLQDQKTVSVLRLLDQVRQSGQTYSGADFLVGYHSLELNGRWFRGQRECGARLAQVPYDFTNKVVVDLGCNSGGMLHFLAQTIRKGVGFDVNPHCINAANAIKSLNRSNNLEFYNFDLDREDLSLLPAFLLNERADICFVLSICMWLKEWRAVLQQAASLANAILFESNGTTAQQDEQLAVVSGYFTACQLIADRSSDDPFQRVRKLYLCTGSKLIALSRSEISEGGSFEEDWQAKCQAATRVASPYTQLRPARRTSRVTPAPPLG